MKQWLTHPESVLARRQAEILEPVMSENSRPINRALQRELLTLLSSVYPHRLRDCPKIEGASEDDIVKNLQYLQEHGLCESGLRQYVNGQFHFGGAKITASGLDFLEEDGGLSAILSTVTVKIHADTLRELLSAKIESAKIAPEEKSTFKERVKNLPEKALEAVTTDLIHAGLQQIPNIAEWLQKFAGF